MPIDYARKLTGKERTDRANRHLGFVLAFVAGAINSGGFLAVARYTSHMTGIVSTMADNLALGAYNLALEAAAGLLSFLFGAVCSAVLVNYARRRRMTSLYAFPLLLEAALLLCFGVLGARFTFINSFYGPLTVILLCFIMGLQNALISKLSRGEIRTTHVTGIVTDIGIELGKLLYWNRAECDSERVIGNPARLIVLASLALCFFLGGVVGALGFTRFGFISTVPLAILLIAIAGVPAIDDALATIRRWR